MPQDPQAYAIEGVIFGVGTSSAGLYGKRGLDDLCGHGGYISLYSYSSSVLQFLKFAFESQLYIIRALLFWPKRSLSSLTRMGVASVLDILLAVAVIGVWLMFVNSREEVLRGKFYSVFCSRTRIMINKKGLLGLRILGRR